MAFRLELEDRLEYCHIVVTGRLDASSSHQMTDEIVRAIAASRHDKVLIDARRMVLGTSVLEDYQQASYAAAQMAGKKHRIAQLGVFENSDADEFFETVGLNRGLNFRTFTDEGPAIDWLLQSRTT